MDRRNFLRTGGMAVLGSLAMPSLAMPGSVRGALGGADSNPVSSVSRTLPCNYPILCN